MKRLEYTLSFTTPAFLGNAEQQAQWRTPPIKALVRQWWRIVKAPQVDYDVNKLRREEGWLFGVAADGGDSRRSLVRFRLSGWEPGKLDKWEHDDRIPHPEVTNREGQVMRIGAQLYLGYGPLAFGETGCRNNLGRPIKDTVLNQAPKRTAIANNLYQTLTLIVPDTYVEEIVQTMQIVSWFGTLGSRSRNGWGAMQVAAKEKTPPIRELVASRLSGLLRPLDQCLEIDWPHSIGTDGNDRPLVWMMAPKRSWREAIKEIAMIKIAFRTQPALSLNGVPQGQFAPRHLLSYPVTHHDVNGKGWGSQGRLANQLRFKVTIERDYWHGVIVHLPCRLPSEMVDALPLHQRNNLDATAQAVWRTVHAVLDQNAQRIC